jgi:O-antigen/teichoic acid export membrane protein
MTEELPARANDTLFARAGRALGWSFASSAVSKLSTLVIGIVLARLLGPHAFGTFAVATVALLALLSFNELGVSLAIVRWPDDPREVVPTVATISVAASALMCGVCYLAAPAFSAAMGDPSATPVVRVLGLSVLISGLSAGPVALLQREFRQDRKMIGDQVGSWTSALVSIGCAVGGMGAMSLAVGQLLGSLIGAVLFAAFAPAGLRFGFNRAKARALLRFGLPLAGSSIVVFAVSHTDKLVVGAVLGPVPLGFYVLAANVANWPNSMFSLPVRSVAPALLARLQRNRPVMRSAFLSVGALLAAVTVPACAVLAAGSGPLVDLVYGPVWHASAAVLGWLALVTLMRVLFELLYDYFVVLANARVVFTVQVVWFLALMPALYIGARWGGPAGAAAAQLVVAALVIAPLYLVELRRTGVAPVAFLARLAPAFAAGAVVAALGGLAAVLVPVHLVALLLCGAAGAAALALLLYRMRATVRSLRGLRADDEADDAGGVTLVAAAPA